MLGKERLAGHDLVGDDGKGVDVCGEVLRLSLDTLRRRVTDRLHESWVG